MNFTSTPGEFTVTWIPSDQDDNTKYEDLDEQAQLNVDMDHDANECRRNGPITFPTPYPGTGAMLIIDNQWVTTKYEEQIHEASIRAEHKEYFTEKYDHIDEQMYDRIHW